MTFLASRNAFREPRGALKQSITSLSIVGLCLYAFLPPAIAVFPQRASVPLGKLEPHLRARGSDDEVVFFNKGL